MEVDDFVFCKIYENRPQECANHDFPMINCPVGANVLGLKNNKDCLRRFDMRQELIKLIFEKSKIV